MGLVAAMMMLRRLCHKLFGWQYVIFNGDTTGVKSIRRLRYTFVGETYVVYYWKRLFTDDHSRGFRRII